MSTLICSCGGSSDSGSSTTTTTTTVKTPETYQWQILNLRSVSNDSLSSSCIRYNESSLNTGEVITAYVAETGYNILYHNADGSIYDTISSTDIDGGLLTISEDDVPDDGYVSLEELSSIRGGDTGSYMFSVKKSLLSDMVLNVSAEQTSSCYAGSDYRETASGTALLNVRQQSTNTEYYQSSYDVDSISGLETASDIPVDSPYPAERDTLITAYDTYDSVNKKFTGLTYWTFVDAASLYEDSSDAGYLQTAALTDDYLSTINWSTNDALTLNDDSGIIALHNSESSESSESYFWQPIYNGDYDLTLAYGSAKVSLWSGYFSGMDSSGWSFANFFPLADSDIDISLYLSISSVDSNIEVTTVCNDINGAQIDFCIDTNDSFDSEEYDYQRTHIRLTETDDDGNSQIVYQSIYSEANEEPTVLENSQFDFDTPTLTRIEFNLISSNADSGDAVQYLMANNIDLVSVGEYDSDSSDDTAETDFYSDINGFITTDTESDSLYQKILNSTTLTLMNAYE
jgi:hypothetical protein